MRRLLLPVVAALCGGIFLAGPVAADPCLVVYPSGPSIYHYESAEYYTVGPGHPLYDPAYDRGGQVLIEAGTNEIPLDIYQAPGIVSFVLDEENQGFFVHDTEFDLVVDGFNNTPITYTNIQLVFDRFEPAGCVPAMFVDGTPAMYDPGCGWHCPLGNLEVCTATPDGCHYSDCMVCELICAGCLSTRIWAFSDENGNGIHDGGECFSAFSHDTVVPPLSATWGAIKQLF